MSGPKPWIVGELNPYGGDEYFAMYPDPPTSAGGRLCFKILRMDEQPYLEAFERRNLCRGRWTMRAARLAGFEIGREAAAAGAPVILLGAKVSAAFNVPFEPWTMLQLKYIPTMPTTVVILPHPSGLCRLWAQPRSYERAREVVLAAAPHLAPLVRSAAA